MFMISSSVECTGPPVRSLLFKHRDGDEADELFGPVSSTLRVCVASQIKANLIDASFCVGDTSITLLG